MIHPVLQGVTTHQQQQVNVVTLGALKNLSTLLILIGAQVLGALTHYYEFGALTYVYGAFIDAVVFLLLLLIHYPTITRYIYWILILQFFSNVVHTFGIVTEILYLGGGGGELIASLNYHLYVPLLTVILVLKLIVFVTGVGDDYSKTRGNSNNRDYANL